jgi:hypothetical protein
MSNTGRGTAAAAAPIASSPPDGAWRQRLDRSMSNHPTRDGPLALVLNTKHPQSGA